MTHRGRRWSTAGILMLALAAAIVSAQERAVERLPRIPADQFERLFTAIKPQPNESPWRQVAWITDITEARRRAIAEDKPILIFTAADGSPLART